MFSNNDADLFYRKPVLQVMLNSKSKNSNLIYCELLINFNYGIYFYCEFHGEAWMARPNRTLIKLYNLKNQSQDV